MDATPPEDWQMEMFHGLMVAHWNLIGSIAHEAHRSGIPIPLIEQALARLIEKNDQSLPPSVRETLNIGVRELRQNYLES